MDPLPIFGLGMGVRGAALGTVGGQAVSAGMALWFFFGQRRRPYRISLTDLKPHWPTIAELVGVGAPSFLAGFGATLLVVLVNTRLSWDSGAVALAAFAICARIQTFVLMPQLGISQGLQPVVGFNAGRGSRTRVLRARNLSLGATVGYGVVVAVLVALLAGPLVAVFVGDDETVATTAQQALRIIAIGFAVPGIAPLVSAYCQSLGRPAPSYLISVGTLLLLKVPLLLAFSTLGLTGVWIGLAAGELAAATAALIVLRIARPDRSVSAEGLGFAGRGPAL